MNRTSLAPLLAAASLCILFASTTIADDWPQWRGPNRDGKSTETGLLKQWPEGGPARLWTNSDVGLGYSSFAVVGDTLYTMGAREDKEFLFALNVADGSEKWSIQVGELLENRWGDGPRGTPTVDGASVKAEVLRHGRGDKVIVFKRKRRKK